MTLELCICNMYAFGTTQQMIEPYSFHIPVIPHTLPVFGSRIRRGKGKNEVKTLNSFFGFLFFHIIFLSLDKSLHTSTIQTRGSRRKYQITESDKNKSIHYPYQSIYSPLKSEKSVGDITYFAMHNGGFSPESLLFSYKTQKICYTTSTSLWIT